MTHELSKRLRDEAAALRETIKTPNIGQTFGDMAMRRNAKIAALYEQAADAIDLLRTDLDFCVKQHYTIEYEQDEASIDAIRRRHKIKTRIDGGEK